MGDSIAEVLQRAYESYDTDDWEKQFESLLKKNNKNNLFDWLCDKYHEDSSKAILFWEKCDKKTQQKFAIAMGLFKLVESKNNIVE